jgi:hypothetical protein
MKSKLKFILFTLVFGLLLSSSVIAQSNPGATVSSDNGITLSMVDPLSENYDIDISDRGWTLEESQEAVVYLESKSKFISLELDYSNQKLILTLELNAPEASSWDVGQWNEHLVQVR